MNGYKYGPYSHERSRVMYYNGALYTVVKVKIGRAYSHTEIYGGSDSVTADTHKFRHSIRLAYWPKVASSYQGPWPVED